MSRRQLPPQIEKITLQSGAVRYQVTAEAGVDPETGKRRQTRKRYRTEKEARDALAETSMAVRQGTYVPNSTLTVEQACSDWLAGKRVRGTTATNYANALLPIRNRYGDLEVQKLAKRHLDDLVTDLLAGNVKKANGKNRRPWAPGTINATLDRFETVLDSVMAEGKLVRNVAALVDRVPAKPKKRHTTFSIDEVRKVLEVAANDRNGHAWHLALAGLRRGEIGGLRWSDIDLEAGTLTIVNNRVSVNGKAEETDPKSEDSGRTLPLTPTLKAELRAARKRQAAEKLALGEAYGPGTHVVIDPAGRSYHPDTLTDYWEKITKTAGVRRIRLHDARHTCGTLMHLQHVPIAVIAEWLGHADSAFTMRTYVHSQDGALAAAAGTLEAVVTIRDKNGSESPRRKRRRGRKSAG
ncbi:site-specific integrase [Nocardia cyriacigeorgica]|uniref:site-specific integrase n=1 Tax=Nocardia cyriacigeorgica TaxID=135487 RepID=UPI0013B8D1FC|nr:site-specific integrase [Nocardia cyriacigeorgica]NEW53748.1 site-specific integrase [Nocardia cyriacigeorgica]